jgi:hypothetical protein
MLHLTSEQLQAGLARVLESPADGGRLEAIFVRPRKKQRTACGTAVLSPEFGIEGDNWLTQNWLFLTDGRPDPRNQVSLMNARLLELLSAEPDRMALAGDNLIVDLDLSDENLPVGQRLAVGGAVLEISDVPHNGCNAFQARYGADAVRFVNSREGKRLHLRGRYARVIEAGTATVGDTVRKIG